MVIESNLYTIKTNINVVTRPCCSHKAESPRRKPDGLSLECALLAESKCANILLSNQIGITAELEAEADFERIKSPGVSGVLSQQITNP